MKEFEQVLGVVANAEKYSTEAKACPEIRLCRSGKGRDILVSKQGDNLWCDGFGETFKETLSGGSVRSTG